MCVPCGCGFNIRKKHFVSDFSACINKYLCVIKTFVEALKAVDNLRMSQIDIRYATLNIHADCIEAGAL